MHIVHTVDKTGRGKSSKRTDVVHIISVQLGLFPLEASRRSFFHQQMLLHLYLLFPQTVHIYRLYSKALFTFSTVSLTR